MFTAKEALNTEISTIDTALFLAGMITALEYFDDPELRDRARRIFERVDWAWARNATPTSSPTARAAMARSWTRAGAPRPRAC
jgi:hypothetical protein